MTDPFPPLTLEDGLWQGEDVFALWKVPTFLTNEGVSSGKARVSVDAPGSSYDSERPPTIEQQEAYRHLKANEAAITHSVLKEIVSQLYRESGEPGEVPDLDQAAEQFREYLMLNTVHVSSVQKEDLAFVGFEIEWERDEEHGLGVLTHRGEVLEIGSADVSFEPWVAEKHGGTDIE